MTKIAKNKQALKIMQGLLVLEQSVDEKLTLGEVYARIATL